LNNHKGGFTQVVSKIGGLTYEPILADLNGDGNLDLILAASSGSGAFIYLGNGKGEFASQTTLVGSTTISGGINLVADINGDGILDVGVLAADTLVVFLGEGNTTYATPFAIGTGPSPGSILVGHFHEQSAPGLPDIVVPDTSGGVMVLVNQTQ